MQTIEDEVIGELRYLTVEFDQTELVTGGMGVISQDAVKRYFMKKCPDLKVKKCGGLKLDSQRDIVTMRIGIVNQLGVENPVGVNPVVADTSPVYGGALNIPGHRETVAEDIKRIEAAADGECVAVSDVFHKTKLLNPGYDELKAERDRLIQMKEVRIARINELKKKYDELQHEKDIVGRLYDALVIAVGKDAQKFTDLLVENEELQKKCNAGVSLRNKLIDDLDETNKQVLRYQKEVEKLTADPFSECPHCVENGELKKQLEAEHKLCRCGKCAEMDDKEGVKPFNAADFQDVVLTSITEQGDGDSTDLAEAKKAIIEDDSIDLDAFEDETDE